MAEPAENLPWRVGRRVGRTIYAVTGTGDDVLIGVMDTRELAAAAVAAHNGVTEPDRPKEG
jgi:hypothetical protein